MPIITEIVLEEVPIGPASDFRGAINRNFDAIKTEFDEVYDVIKTEFDEVYEVMVDIELSPEEPTTQKVGDIWLKDLGEAST